MKPGYISVSEVAKEWNIKERTVQLMCSKGKIPGACKDGKTWCIPLDVERPEDERLGTGEYRDYRKAARGEISKRAQENMQFMLNMSHDIRSELNNIFGYSEILKRHTDDKNRIDECLNNIDDSGNQILELINNVIEYSRLENGVTELSEEVFNVENVLNEIVDSLKENPEYNGHKIDVNYNINNEFVYLDRALHEQMLKNILDNAIRYTPQNGSISIDVTEIPSRLDGKCLHQYTIEDNGIGITEAYIDHIYEPFSKDSGKRITSKGCGLGMAIVKKIVTLKKGNIKIESSVDSGTKVTVTLPFDIADLTQYRMQQNIVADIGILKGKRLLVAEDNDLNREVAVEVLGEFGAKVDTVKDGILCVAMVEMKPPAYYDAILMDLRMPNMDGIAATNVIRNLDDSRNKIPIIAMTASVTNEDKKTALLAGMNGFVEKPVDIKKVCSIMQSVL